MGKFVKLSLIGSLLAGLYTIPAVAFAQGEFDGKDVKVGVVSDNELTVWEKVAEVAKEKEGISLEVVQFTDYIQPNEALKNGSIDLNAFQHTAYLKDWNEANDGGLEAIGFTYVSPMGAYSDKVKSFDELKEGAVVSVPNDPTNEGRALLLLQIAGVIKLDEKAGALATPDDIVENPKNLKFEELDAAQVAVSLKDVDVAVINTNFAIDNNLSLKDAIFVDTANPADLATDYKNIVAARSEDKDNPLYKKVVELYQTKETADLIKETSKGADVAIWDTIKE